jgi:lipopolysaccharide export system protein LptC
MTDQDQKPQPDIIPASRERLDRLVGNAEKRAGFNPNYSKFIRRLRLILPLIALGILAVVFSWSSFTEDDLLVITPPPGENTQEIGKNELLNPRFESKDDKNQPYTITATRAIQGKDNENLIILEEPLADILLKNGNWIAIQSKQGAYRQDSERLLLQDEVTIFHDEGYQMTTSELHMDMIASLAWSEKDVAAQGPAGLLDAKGMKADSKSGELIFTGPAKLILHRGFEGFDRTKTSPADGAP